MSCCSKRQRQRLFILSSALGGAALGWLLEVALVAGGRSMVIPPLSFAAALVVLAIAVIAVAIPVRRVAKGRTDAHGRPARVDPFYATRVLALAKSAILVGALLVGGMLAILAYAFTRPVVNEASILPVILGVIAAAAVLAAGLLAEEMCRIPPKDHDDHPDDAEPLPLNGGH